MDKRETAGILALLSSAYPYAKVTKETAAMFHEVWKDLSFVECQRAVGTVIRTSEMFPSAAQIRKEVMRQMGVMSSSSAEAWSEVMNQVREIGRYGRPKFSSQAVTDTVLALGWREICDSENQGVLRAHFFKMYDKMAEEHDRTALLSSVGELGSGNATNSLEAGQAVETDGVQETE